jgi:hypothetical protein
MTVHQARTPVLRLISLPLFDIFKIFKKRERDSVQTYQDTDRRNCDSVPRALSMEGSRTCGRVMT